MNTHSITPASSHPPLLHTADDPDRPHPRLLTDPARPYARPVGELLDLTGCGCPTRPYLYRDTFNRVTTIVVRHAPICSWYRQLATSGEAR